MVLANNKYALSFRSQRLIPVSNHRYYTMYIPLGSMFKCSSFIFKRVPLSSTLKFSYLCKTRKVRVPFVLTSVYSQRLNDSIHIFDFVISPTRNDTLDDGTPWSVATTGRGRGSQNVVPPHFFGN